MKTVNTYYSHALNRYANSCGIVISSITPEAVNQRVKLDKQGQVWQRLSSQIGESLGVKFGQSIQAPDLGSLGYLLLSLDTLGQALKYLSKFYPLVGEGGVVKITSDSHKTTIFYRPDYTTARKVRVEAVLSSIVTIAKTLLEDNVEIGGICVDYAMHADVKCLLAQHSGSMINDMSSDISLWFPSKSMSQPLHHANPAITSRILPILEADLDAISSLSAEEKVRRLLNQQPYLSRGQIAERMNISERSLGRKLSAFNTDFASIKKQELSKIAKSRLSQGMSVTQVAELLGYNDSSAFIKAYKNWAGISPAKDQRLL